MNPSDVRVGRFQNGSKKSQASPPVGTTSYKFIGGKSNRRSNGNNGSNSNSKGRFDFVGPYAQNLRKPKLYEARGTQKIALKNHLASLQHRNHNHLGQKNLQSGAGPFNSEVFAQKKTSIGQYDGVFQPMSYDGVDDRMDKHSHRFASHDARGEEQESFQGNYVI